MTHTVPVVVVKEDDVYVAKDVVTSVASQGETIEKAVESLKEALELYYDDNNDYPEYRDLYTTTLEVCV